MNDIRIEFDELKTLEAGLRAHPDVVREELGRAITEADLLLEREIRDAWPRASGISRASMHTVERVDGLKVEGFVGSSLNYVRPVDLGTRPHFPPVDALIDWVKLRFQVSSEAQARGIAFVIARKIAARGTKGAFVFRDVLARLTPQLREIFVRAQAKIAARMGLG